MPEIALLEPTVFTGVVEQFTSAERLELLNRIPKTPWPYPSATWDILRGSRAVARANVPNSEAHIVPRLGRSRASVSFMYLREKKVFETTTLEWLRAPGQIAAANAEAAILRELRDLNGRFDNFAEWALWEALSGELTVEDPELGAIADVDYQFLASHKPTGSTWSTDTPQEIVEDIRAWKRLIERDGGVKAVDAYATEATVTKIFDSFASRGDAGTNFAAAALLSDRMKDQYYSSGTLPGFMGLAWHNYESVYSPTGAGYTENPTNPGQETNFLVDDRLVLGNFTDNRPFELYIGPSADSDAPSRYTGKFAKNWTEKDPSQPQYLLEWNIMPVITRTEQFVNVSSVG